MKLIKVHKQVKTDLIKKKIFDTLRAFTNTYIKGY